MNNIIIKKAGELPPDTEVMVMTQEVKDALHNIKSLAQLQLENMHTVRQEHVNLVRMRMKGIAVFASRLYPDVSHPEY